MRPGFPCFLCRAHVGLASEARTLRYTSGQLVTVAPGQLSVISGYWTEVGEDTLSSDEGAAHSSPPTESAVRRWIEGPATSASPPALPQREERAQAREQVGPVGAQSFWTVSSEREQLEERARASARVERAGPARALGLATARAPGLVPVPRVRPEEHLPYTDSQRVALSGGRSWSPTSGLSASAGAATGVTTPTRGSDYSGGLRPTDGPAVFGRCSTTGISLAPHGRDVYGHPLLFPIPEYILSADTAGDYRRSTGWVCHTGWCEIIICECGQPPCLNCGGDPGSCWHCALRIGFPFVPNPDPDAVPSVSNTWCECGCQPWDASP